MATSEEEAASGPSVVDAWSKALGDRPASAPGNAAQVQIVDASAPKKRGRPVGSKNAPKVGTAPPNAPGTTVAAPIVIDAKDIETLARPAWDSLFQAFGAQKTEDKEIQKWSTGVQPFAQKYLPQFFQGHPEIAGMIIATGFLVVPRIPDAIKSMKKESERKPETRVSATLE